MTIDNILIAAADNIANMSIMDAATILAAGVVSICCILVWRKLHAIEWVVDDLRSLSPSTNRLESLQELKNILGSDIQKKFVKGNFTRWGHDRWTLGSYASAEPGYFHMREVLRRPVAERIFFAGEACHGSLWALCSGAHLSGIETATDVAHAV